MRALLPFLAPLFCFPAFPQSSPGQIWDQLQARRDTLPSFHQEFEISRTFKFATGTQSGTEKLVLDASKNQWRERLVSGAGNRTEIFDGNSAFVLGENTTQYTRTKLSRNEEPPLSNPYSAAHLDLAKAVELGRKPCGLPNVDHTCVILKVPVMPSNQTGSGGAARKIIGGSEALVFDTETGLLLSSRRIEAVESQNGGYQAEVSYVLIRMTYGAQPNQSLFALPATATVEVKKLSRWDATSIKAEFGGQPAPDLALRDLQGKPISLAALKGKTILLDFWATWCGPCRADGPALDKLYRKYSERGLVIIGISVDEDRATVEKFLSEHPHQYPIVLTTDNDMPAAYQMHVFPTYLVIDGDGKVAFATEGDAGFSELRKLLKKAGLDTN